VYIEFAFYERRRTIFLPKKPLILVPQRFRFLFWRNKAAKSSEQEPLENWNSERLNNWIADILTKKNVPNASLYLNEMKEIDGSTFMLIPQNELALLLKNNISIAIILSAERDIIDPKTEVQRARLTVEYYRRRIQFYEAKLKEAGRTLNPYRKRVEAKIAEFNSKNQLLQTISKQDPDGLSWSLSAASRTLLAFLDARKSAHLADKQIEDIRLRLVAAKYAYKEAVKKFKRKRWQQWFH